MNTILYIENNYCQSLKQLQEYFKKDLKQGAPLFEELLTLQRDGLIANWLNEGNEDEQKIADQLNDLSPSLNTSDLMKEVAKIIVNQEINYDVSVLTYVEIDNIQIGCEGKFTSIKEGKAVINKAWWKKDIVIRYYFKIKNTDKETFTIKAEALDDLLCEINLTLDNQQIGSIIKVDVPLSFSDIKKITKSKKDTAKMIFLLSNNEVLSKTTLEIKNDISLLSYVDFVEIQLGDRGNFKVISQFDADIYERVTSDYVLRCVFKVKDVDDESFKVESNMSNEVNEIDLSTKNVGDIIESDFPLLYSDIKKIGHCTANITSNGKTIASLTLNYKGAKKFSFQEDVHRFITLYMGNCKLRSPMNPNDIPQKMLDDLENQYFVKMDKSEFANCHYIKYLVNAIWSKYTAERIYNRCKVLFS